MANDELIADLLVRLDERYDLARYSSIHELIGVDAELRDQLQATPELAAELELGFVALRKMDACFGRDDAGASDRWPDIPGYEVQGELGFGGMGVVYKARQATLNRTVALKVMLGGRLGSRRVARRFHAEAEAVARLRHPNIVQVFESGKWQGGSFIILEYMAAGNLARQVAGIPQAERWAAEAIRSIALAVEHAHQAGIVHRDLKPSNILLASDGTLKVADFGLAKLLDDNDVDLTRSGEAPGTPSYMAPEQTRGVVSPQTDIYAMGAILYELLTGHPPFAAETTAETLVQVQMREPIAPRLIRPKLATDLEAICLKCLEKDPQRRYDTAAQLAADLGRFAAGQTTKARPLTGLQRTVRWAQRNRRIAALLATVAGLLVCVAVVSTAAAVRIAGVARSEREAREEVSHALLAERKARDAAQTQAAAAAEVSGFMVDLFMTADPMGSGRLGFQQGDEVGRNLTLRDLLDRGSQQAQNALQDQPEVRAALLASLGRVYSNLGLLTQGEPLVREAYEIRQQHRENEADLAASLLDMGVMLHFKGDYDESVRLLRQALEIRTRLTGPDSLSVAEVELKLGYVLMEMSRISGKRNTETERLLRHALQIQERELGANHCEVGLTKTLLCLYLYAFGNPADFQAMLASTVAVYMQQEGGMLLGVAVFQFQRAAIARKSKNYDAAEKHYRSCLDVMQKVLGKGHVFTLMIAADLGGMLREMGRWEEFERHGHEVMDIALRARPNGHPALVEAINGWLPFILSQGKYEEAEALVEKKISVVERFFHSNWEQQMTAKLDLASLRIDQGRLDEASRVLDEVQKSIDANQPPMNSALVRLHSQSLAALAIAHGDFADAERYYRKCIAAPHQLFELVLPWLELRLAEAIHHQRPFDPEAEQLLRGLIGGFGLLPAYPDTVVRSLFMAQLLIDQERLDEVESFLRPAHEFAHHKTMPGSYFVGMADSLMGAWLAAKGKPNEAEPLLIAGLENLRTSRGDHHRLTHEARDRLVSFYRQAGRDADAQRYCELLTVDSAQPPDRAIDQ